MEVRRFVGDPAQEAPNIWASFQDIEIRKCRGQIVIGYAGVNDTVTDRMNWHDLGTATALWNAMMPFHLST